ncbi:SUMF1/EgtB/PvdO family nonheme iron enzyme [Nonomuraea recticatena]
MRETSTILREINARVEARRCAAEAGGARLLPPLLMLGTMERVGSNWLSDTLRVAMDQHNEPLRQQLAHDHPLSPLNPDAAGLVAAERRLTPYSRHCLVAFTVSKYATIRQVIKETNLFFAVPNVLELFPDAPVVVLTRSPLGVASSFARGRLFERWDYRARYRQMVDAARRPDVPVAGAAALVPDDDPDDLVALARLHVLNTVLLAAALGTRSDDAGDATGGEIVCIPYESAVRSPAAGWHSLARVLPELAGSARPAAAQPATPPTAARAGAAQAVAEDTFVTTVPKTALTTHLDERSAELVRAAAAAALDTAQREFPAGVTAQAVEWLAGDHLYTPAPPARPSTGRRPLAAAARRGRSALRPGYVTREGLSWRNLLVSNAEFARFLNELADHGVDNRSGGAYLLCCEMPHERGGRLHQTDDGRWTVSPGFEDHPAYWVTWIGAAAFAARHGARLPLLDEMVALMAGDVAPDVAANTDYAVGDTVPVVQDGVAGDAIHHVIGNVQVWCSDGPGSEDEPMARWLTGAAWNTPSAWQEVLRRRARHLAGSSRGVGVRLVQNEPRQPVPADELAALLREWMSGLQERSLPLHVLDGRLTAALAAASQADVGLGAHVGAGFGPSGLGQLDEAGAEAERGQVGERHELHAADRGGVGALGDGAHGAAGAGGLERHVDDVGAAAGQVVAHVQQPVDSHFDAGLFTHLAGEGVGEAFPSSTFPPGSDQERPVSVSWSSNRIWSSSMTMPVTLTFITRARYPTRFRPAPRSGRPGWSSQLEGSARGCTDGPDTCRRSGCPSTTAGPASCTSCRRSPRSAPPTP